MPFEMASPSKASQAPGESPSPLKRKARKRVTNDENEDPSSQAYSSAKPNVVDLDSYFSLASFNPEAKTPVESPTKEATQDLEQFQSRTKSISPTKFERYCGKVESSNPFIANKNQVVARFLATISEAATPS